MAGLSAHSVDAHDARCMEYIRMDRQHVNLLASGLAVRRAVVVYYETRCPGYIRSILFTTHCKDGRCSSFHAVHISAEA